MILQTSLILTEELENEHKKPKERKQIMSIKSL